MDDYHYIIKRREYQNGRTSYIGNVVPLNINGNTIAPREKSTLSSLVESYIQQGLLYTSQEQLKTIESPVKGNNFSDYPINNKARIEFLSLFAQQVLKGCSKKRDHE